MTGDVPVINLVDAPGERASWDRPRIVVFLWAAVEILVLSNPWQPSSKLRRIALRAFGATVGSGVVIRPRTRVRFPWKLTIGDRSWIGEGVWLHNQAQISIGSDAVISQEAFLTTGSHAIRTDMGLLLSPIVIDDGVWVTSRCIVLGGSIIGRSSVIAPGEVVRSAIPPNVIWRGGSIEGPRFR